MNKQLTGYLVLVAILLICTAGCSDSTRPEDDVGVILSLDTEIANDEGEPYVVAVIRVENMGPDTVEYGPGCGFLVGLTVEDADENRLELLDPGLVPICPPVRHTLSAGEEIIERWSLRWVWDDQGNQYLIPSGSYTVRTVFGYSKGTEESFRLLEKVLQIELN